MIGKQLPEYRSYTIVNFVEIALDGVDPLVGLDQRLQVLINRVTNVTQQMTNGQILIFESANAALVHSLKLCEAALEFQLRLGETKFNSLYRRRFFLCRFNHINSLPNTQPKFQKIQDG